MSNLFKTYYRAIRNGQNVNESVTNQPLEDIFQNTLYLKAELDRIAAGKALVLTEQEISSAATVGMPVYRDTDGVWKPAWAELDTSAGSTLFRLTKRAEVCGVVSVKTTATTGSVATNGQITLTAAEVLPLIDGAYTPGIVYLSSQFPGYMTRNSLRTIPITVGILSGPNNAGAYTLVVNAEPKAQVESHGHLRFDLVDAPAGDANCVPGKTDFMWGELEEAGPYPGVVHVVENADVTAQGWLPATDPSFAGLDIPVGAKFGYNLQADADVLANWPPMPIDNVVITVDGVVETGNLVVLTLDGIWWMDDRYGKAPWPVNTPCVSSTVPESSSSTPYPIWPIRIEMWFTKVTHGTTLAAINEHIEAKVGVYPDMSPVVVGDIITQGVVPGTVIPAYVLPKQLEPSSSSGTGIDENNIFYQVSTRRFSAVASRQPTLTFSLLLAGNSSIANPTTLQTIWESCFTFNLSILTDNAYGQMQPLTNVVNQTLAYDVTEGPVPGSGVPTSQFFSIQTETIALPARSMLALKITWNGVALGSSTDALYLMAVRPIITYPG